MSAVLTATKTSRIKDPVLVEQISHVMRQAKAGALAAAVVSALYAAVLWQGGSHGLILGWFIALNMVGVLRVVVAQRWLASAANPAARIQSGVVLVISALSGLGWGVAATVMFPTGQSELYFIVAFLLIGMPAGALSSFGAWHPAFWSYLAFSAGPFAIWTLTSGQSHFVLTGIAAVVFIGFLTREGWASSMAFRKIIQQRRELEALTQSLVGARDAAEAANRAKSSFLANMSHEIRTPLNAVIGLGDLLIENLQKPENLEYATVIRDSAQSLLAIINDVLDLSRIEAGRVDIQHEPFFLRDSITEIENMFRQQATSKRLALTFITATDVPAKLIGDAFRVRQVLVNLVANALKFTDHGSVAVSISREPSNRDAANACVIRFEVHDTGIGIPEESKHLLFQAFSQLDSSSSRVHQGSGLGLRISSELIGMMGGKIGLASERERGSTFWFTVPFALPVAVLSVSAPRAA